MFKDSTAEAGSIMYNHGDNYIKLSTTGTNGGNARFMTGANNNEFKGTELNSSEVVQGGSTYICTGTTQLQGNYNQDTWTPLFRVGHSHCGTLTIWITPGGTLYQNGTRQFVYNLHATYGYTGWSARTSFNSNALGAGLTSFDVAYQNTGSGGNPDYYVKVKGVWAAGLGSTPKVHWSWIGQNSAYPYAL